MASYLVKSPVLLSLEAKESGSNNRQDLNKCYEWLTSKKSRAKTDLQEKGDSESDDFEDISLPKAPDGGWGWAVVFGAFNVSLICDGISYCFGVLYSELLHQYKESKSKTSFVGSVFFGVSMTLGPVSSVLTSKYGCRTMTIVGGLTSALGMFLSMFAPTLDVLFVTFGLIVGAGFSFCFNASIVIVSFYFEKRRSLATGLAVCGTGFGTVTFAPFMDYLIENYNLAGLFLILSGVCLNLVVCGMLFRPLAFTKQERRRRMLHEFDQIPYDRGNIEMPSNYFGASVDDDEDEDTMSSVCVPTFAPEHLKKQQSVTLMKALQKGKNPDLTLHRYMTNALLQINYTPDSLAFESSVDRKGIFRNRSVIKKLKIEPSLANFISETILKAAVHVSIIAWPTRERDVVSNADRGSILIKQGHRVRRSLQLAQHPPSQEISQHARRSKQLSRKAETLSKSQVHKPYQLITSTSSIAVSNPTASSTVADQRYFLTLLPLYRTDIFFRRLDLISCTVGTSCPQLYTTDIYGEKKTAYLKLLGNDMWRFCKSLLDCSLLCNLFFSVFLLSNFLYYFWSDVPYMYATDHAKSVGVDHHKSALLVSYIGVANTMGQIFFGIIGDLDVNLIKVYAVASTISGVFVGCVPLTSTYEVIVVCYALFGFFIAVSYPLTTVILVQNLGLRKLTSAYGLLMLTQGIANFLGPVVSGQLADASGNYDLSFYSSGIFYCASGLVLYLVYIPKWYRRLCARKPKTVWEL